MERMLTMTQVCEIVGLSRSRVNVMRAKGQFPPGKLYPSGALRFPEGEVQTWIDTKPNATGDLGGWEKYTRPGAEQDGPAV